MKSFWDLPRKSATAPLTRDTLATSFESILKAPQRSAVWFVSPKHFRLGKIAWAYLHGYITREEYGRLFYLELWLLLSEET